MVLTDGGAQRPTEMFEKYNHNKTVYVLNSPGMVWFSDTNIHIPQIAINISLKGCF